MDTLCSPAAACPVYCFKYECQYRLHDKIKKSSVVLLLCVFGALLPDSASVFLMGCVMVAHVYAVSMEMALITLMMILVVAVLYYGFKPGDSWLMILTPLAFLFKGALCGCFFSRAGRQPDICDTSELRRFFYYLLMYIRQNAGVLTGEGSVDIVQRYSQIIRSVCFNQTMMVMIAACAVGIMVVYLIRRLSVDYAWIIAIVVGTVAQLLVIFVGDFVFRGIRICRNADLRAACFCDAGYDLQFLFLLCRLYPYRICTV